jgi:hypothetical protein
MASLEDQLKAAQAKVDEYTERGDYAGAERKQEAVEDVRRQIKKEETFVRPHPA